MTISYLVSIGEYKQEEINDALKYAKKYNIKIHNKKYRTIGFLCDYTPDEKDERCLGLWTYSARKKQIEIIDEDCMGNSSYAHELMHFFEFHIKHFSSPDHDNTKIFKRGCYLKYPEKLNSKGYDENAADRFYCVTDTAEFKINIDYVLMRCSQNEINIDLIFNLITTIDKQ